MRTNSNYAAHYAIAIATGLTPSMATFYADAQVQSHIDINHLNPQSWIIK